MARILPLWLLIAATSGLLTVSLWGCQSKAQTDQKVAAAKKEAERIAEALNRFVLT